MKNKIVTILKDLYAYKYTYILRATILQLVITTLGSYVLSLLLRAALVSSDLPGLTIDNLSSFLINPMTLGLLLLYLFALAFLVFFEFTLLVEMLRYKEEKLRLTFSRLKEDIGNFFTSLSGGHIVAFLVYLILTIPFLQLFLSSALLENLYIPKFISGELVKTTSGSVIYYGLYALLGYLNLRFIYTLPLTVTNKGQHFAQSMAQSWKMTKGRKLFALSGLLLVLFILMIVTMVFVVLGISIASVLDSNKSDLLIETLFLSFVWGTVFAASLLFKLGFLSYLLHVLDLEKAEQDQLTPQKPKKGRSFALVALLIAIGGVSFIYNSSGLSSQKTENIQVIAHRGLVSKGVENSLEALEAVAKAGADYVEMDVIYSKDGQFVVSHDDNLKRLTGKNIAISDSKAEQVVGLPIHQNGHKSHLVSFDTYVKKAKELGIKLLVELKPTGKEARNYEQDFVDKLNQLGVSRDYLVMSLDLPTVEKVKRLDKNLTVGYTISLQVGDFTNQTVDFYAIEDFSYNEWLAASAHAKGKKIYAWTINAEEDITKYLQSSSDGIITDYPTDVKEMKANFKKDDSYLEYFLRIFSL